MSQSRVVSAATIPALRDDVFEPELARVLEDHRLVAADMLGDVHPLGPRHRSLQLCLASCKRQRATIHSMSLSNRSWPSVLGHQRQRDNTSLTGWALTEMALGGIAISPLLP